LGKLSGLEPTIEALDVDGRVGERSALGEGPHHARERRGDGFRITRRHDLAQVMAPNQLRERAFGREGETRPP
jgi:hypothetical protein